MVSAIAKVLILTSVFASPALAQVEYAWTEPTGTLTNELQLSNAKQFVDAGAYSCDAVIGVDVFDKTHFRARCRDGHSYSIVLKNGSGSAAPWREGSVKQGHVDDPSDQPIGVPQSIKKAPAIDRTSVALRKATARLIDPCKNFPGMPASAMGLDSIALRKITYVEMNTMRIGQSVSKIEFCESEKITALVGDHAPQAVTNAEFANFPGDLDVANEAISLATERVAQHMRYGGFH
jgi:hypothetical protein